MRKINISVTLIIISGGFLFSGCQSVKTKVIAPSEVLAEFEIQGGMNFIILPVTFQGQEYPFALDTAGMKTLFDDSFKDKLGKRFLWPLKGRGAEGKIFKIEWYRRYDCYLGPLDLDDNGTIKVIDLDKLVPGKNRKFQGIIGLDFLKKYIVQIDFDNGKVKFFKGRKEFDILSFLKPKENKHPEWGEPIPMKAKFLTGLRYVKGNLFDNMNIEFLVDTGWLSCDSLKSRIFDKIYSQQNSNEKSGDVKSSSTGLSSYNIINQIENFSVGSLEYNNHIFRRSNESVLGLAFLQRHLVTLDFPNNIMYLKKGNNFDQYQRPLFGISFEGIGCKVNIESFVVTEVDPNGSAYRKGIREEDILIKMNDQDVSSLSSIVEITEFLSQLAAQENREHTFTFKHGDEIITVPFSERDMDTNKN